MIDHYTQNLFRPSRHLLALTLTIFPSYKAADRSQHQPHTQAHTALPRLDSPGYLRRANAPRVPT